MELVEYKLWLYKSNIEVFKDSIYVLFFSTVLFAIHFVVSPKLACRILYNSRLSDLEKSKVRQKWCSSVTKFIIYTFLAVYGIFTLRKEDWTTSAYKYTLTWRENLIPTKIKIYYYLEFSHYLTSTITLFYEPKLSDFFQMLLHHIVTLFLIGFSYHKNLLRYGVVIMLIHDICDPFMEIAKLFFYAKKQKFADIMFVIFAIVFNLMRCVVYPFFLAFPAIYYIITHPSDCCHRLLGILLLVLLVINLIWTLFIWRMFSSFMKTGSLKKSDIREPEEGVKKEN